MNKSQLTMGNLIVKKSAIHGYGVFANQDFQPGDIIEECYALVRNQNESGYEDFYFTFKDKEKNIEKKVAILLGFGCIYNHATIPNASYQFDIEHSLAIFKANCAIKKGQEIFVSYGKNWFDKRDMELKELSWKYRFKKYKPFILMLLRFGVVASGVIALIILSKKGV